MKKKSNRQNALLSISQHNIMKLPEYWREKKIKCPILNNLDNKTQKALSRYRYCVQITKNRLFSKIT